MALDISRHLSTVQHQLLRLDHFRQKLLHLVSSIHFTELVMFINAGDLHPK
jgi:hypothetical protein